MWNKILTWGKALFRPKKTNNVETVIEASDSNVESKMDNSCNTIIKIFEINIKVG